MRKRNSYLFLLIFVIIIGTIIVIYYQQRNSQQNSLLKLPKLEVGDWVVRMGTVNDSWWISYLSNSEYSYIGMIVATEPKVLVIHATTDDGEIGSDQVIVNELDRFLSPALAKKGAIIRPIFLDSKKKRKLFLLSGNNGVSNLYWQVKTSIFFIVQLCYWIVFSIFIHHFNLNGLKLISLYLKENISSHNLLWIIRILK